MPAPVLHPSHEAARERLVRALANVVWACTPPARRRDPQLPDRVAAFELFEKAFALNSIGRTRMCSEETWSDVATEIRMRVAAERGELA